MVLTPPPIAIDDPSNEPLYEVSLTNTPNDGRVAHGTVILDPASGLPMQPSAITFTSLSIADGADVAEGATTDAATANTVIGRLKKLISLVPTALTGAGNFKTAILEALPAGANTIGGVTVANGADVALGATSDALGAPTVIGQLKAIADAPPVAFYSHDFTATGTGATVDGSGDPPVAYALQVSGVDGLGAAQAATTWAVHLQKSLDQVNWQTVLSHVQGTNADGAIVSTIASPGMYMRALVDGTLTLGSAAALRVSFVGKS